MDIHMVCGYLGSGKTTFATQLAAETGAKFLSSEPWASERPHVFEETATLLSRGESVVLDCGFWRRADRDHARALGQKYGAQVKMYHLACPEEVMWSRVSEQNARAEGDSGRIIDQQTFLALKANVEPYGEDEEFEIVFTGDGF
jgi:predicted kinase